MIETSQLQTLVAIARTGSFSKAAEDLQVTQSAISQSIKALEKKIEVSLFKRQGRKVVLTQEGDKLYKMAQSYLQQMDNIVSDLKSDKESMKGEIRVGTLNGVGKSWLAPILLDFAKDFPDISFKIDLGYQGQLIEQFENLQLDCLVLPDYDLPSIGEKIFLSEERSTIVYPKDPKFKINEKTTLAELVAYPVILFERNDPLFLKWCRERFGKIPTSYQSKIIINSHGNMMQAVSQGLGFAVVPYHLFTRSFYRDKVKTFGDKFSVKNSRFYFIYHKEQKDVVKIQKLIKYLINSDRPLSQGITRA